VLRLRLVHRSQHVRSRMVIHFMSGCSFKVAPCSVPFIYNLFFCLPLGVHARMSAVWDSPWGRAVRRGTRGPTQPDGIALLPAPEAPVHNHMPGISEEGARGGEEAFQ
jgi:hypothetical protein